MTIQTDSSSKLHYLNKNIFTITKDRVESASTGATVIIPHVCNNVNAFGAGFADAIAHTFPIVKENFHLLRKPVLGQNQNILVMKNKQYGHELIVINMIAQNGLINKQNIRPLNYGALSMCMLNIKHLVKNLNSQSDTSTVEIHAPKFGSGLAGGQWKFIECLIHDIWNDIPVFIYNPISSK